MGNFKYVNGALTPLSEEEETELLAQQPTPEQESATHLNTLLVKLSEETTRLVGLHIDPIEKAHWMGVADALSRKQALWLGDQFSVIPDPELYPPLSADDLQMWSNLAVIQKLTEAIRNAAALIEQELYQKTDEEILLITIDDIVNHVLWP